MNESTEDNASNHSLSLESFEHIEDASYDVIHAVELFESMQRREKQYCSFSPQSVFVKYYRAVATNICEICLFFSYSLSTCMVALQYFCRACSVMNANPKDFNAISVVCVILAAKYEESCLKVPTYKEILQLIPNEFESAEVLSHWELQVLSFLKWKLRCDTAAHFLDLFLSILKTQLGDLYKEFYTVSYARLQSIILWYPAIVARPSFLMSGVIAETRQFFGLPIWNENLSHLTGYNTQNIENMIDYLHRYCYLRV